MINLLQQGIEQGLFHPLDVEFARCVASDDPATLFAAAVVSLNARQGHVCLSLDKLADKTLFTPLQQRHLQGVYQLCTSLKNAEDWQHHLQQQPAVTDGLTASPLVLMGTRLYLQRLWQSEGEIAAYILNHAKRPHRDTPALNAILDRYFPSTLDEQIDWQKVAAAVAATSQVSVISGGPGTGKTTTVTKLLAILIELQQQESDKPLRIQLAAPTGKAAARLTESLGHSIKRLQLSADIEARLPQEAFTLHRLLGAIPNSQRVRHHKSNPLHLDVLVVDEASMVDLPMMAKLVDALPEEAKVIFLGDREQLSSVEAGAVLGDLCQFIELGYTEKRMAQLQHLTGYNLTSTGRGSVVSDCLALLRVSHRFQGDSGIGVLANATNAGNEAKVLATFDAAYQDIAYSPLSDTQQYQQMLNDVVAGYGDYLDAVKSNASVETILTKFSQYRVLCALREGLFGVTGLNQQIEMALIKHGLISKQEHRAFYAGRPVMISENDAALGLYNGDIGIALWDNELAQLRVYFQLPDGNIKSVHARRLPAHETAYAMTVHKSQGSEFAHTALILPLQFTPLLTRELIYTGMTRAKEKLSLYGDKTILMRAIKQKTARRSGLFSRLSV